MAYEWWSWVCFPAVYSYPGLQLPGWSTFTCLKMPCSFVPLRLFICHFPLLECPYHRSSSFHKFFILYTTQVQLFSPFYYFASSCCEVECTVLTSKYSFSFIYIIKLRLITMPCFHVSTTYHTAWPMAGRLWNFLLAWLMYPVQLNKHFQAFIKGQILH